MTKEQTTISRLQDLYGLNSFSGSPEGLLVLIDRISKENIEKQIKKFKDSINIKSIYDR